MTVLCLEPIGESFSEKRINLASDILKVGRKISAKNPPEPYNGIFESKVLSRAHAEIWNDKGKVMIKDVGSSNGTFINGKRISEEGQASAAFELHTGDVLEFGIDIKNEEGDDILYRKVSAKVKIISDDSSQNYSEALLNFETIIDKQIEKAENTQSELELIKNIILDLTSKIESIPPAVSKKKILMDLDEAHTQERHWIDKYTNLLQSSKQNEKDLELLKIDNQNLTDDAEYTKCQLELSEDRIKELEEKQNFYEKENQLIKDEYAKMRTDNKILSEKLEKEERQNERFKKRISELEENCSKIKYENMDDINIAQDQVNELNKKIAELNEKIQFLEMEKKDIIVSKNDIRDELNYQKNEFKQKIDDWKEKEKTWNEDMNKLKSEMDNKNSKNDELTREIQILKEENQKNLERHIKEDKETKNIEETEKTFETLKNNNKILKEENEKLKKSIEENKQKERGSLKEFNSYKNKLIKDKEVLEKENKDLQEQLIELQQWKQNKEKEEEALSHSNDDKNKSIPSSSTINQNKDTIQHQNQYSSTGTINRKNKNKKNKKDNKKDVKSELEPEPVNNKIDNKGDKGKENQFDLPASSTSSLATLDFNDDKSKQIQDLAEEENKIVQVIKTVVIPLVLGVSFSIIINYLFIQKN